ncbi:sigma-70 family RNA polymerase sigma factor [Streptomonospora nanhaiensis]|uniref:RNA polymerase sigma-70 factor (ECF subfamily) n=1 Tax=Streptomonospora nanhaiensis TaxID=1323731 RepID=A0A853BGL4_9ACTN|nr:sigma-70 family RNA polymerase sigma factor [Streptomonospora nanhaiensis]MBV2366459.1 sigma-70 family RNA polymerase sigma factor [Streptomonospora nanhaiensis]MBX9389260.1 sigma-70 family RNA polymerase sigma factor [Streptomonospora nanhaiensis]NYI94170.1 RNA polymerase sigma-70 factor (ECF subfamily) [Streptomonospora nanhaiensis]
MPIPKSPRPPAGGVRPARAGRPRRGDEPTADDRAITETALAARRGVAGAVDDFVRLTRPQVWRFVAHLTDQQSADDLTQETFVRALRALPSFAGRAPARVWLMAIARRTVVDHFRAMAARPRPARSGRGEAAADAARRTGPSFEEELVLDDLLRHLSEPRRTAFWLTQVEGHSYAQAAAVVGVPVGTIRSRVARARDDLIAALRTAEEAARGVPGPRGERPAEAAAAAERGRSAPPRTPGRA